MATAVLEPTAPTKQVIRMELVCSGFTADEIGGGYRGRRFDASAIRQLGENTQRMQATHKAVFSVHRGHPNAYSNPEDQVSEGWILGNFEVRPRQDYPDEVGLWADVELSGSLLRDYKAGYLPRWSIEPSDGWTSTPTGELVGPYITGLGLFGRDPVAYPSLDAETPPGFMAKIGRAFMQLFQSMKFDSESSAPASEPVVKLAAEGAPMPDIEKLKTIYTMMGEVIAGYAEMPGEEPKVEVEVTPPAEAKADEYDKAAELASELAQLKADRVYDRLEAAGRVLPDLDGKRREAFRAVVAAKGEEFATATFAVAAVEQPTKMGALTSASATGLDEKTARRIAHAQQNIERGDMSAREAMKVFGVTAQQLEFISTGA